MYFVRILPVIVFLSSLYVGFLKAAIPDAGQTYESLTQSFLPELPIREGKAKEKSGDLAPILTQEKGKTFYIKKLSFLPSPIQLTGYEPVLKKYQELPMNIARLQQLAKELTGLLRDQGYLLSKVVIPTQRIADDQVTFEIVPGGISKVDFEGDVQDLSERIQDLAEDLEDMDLLVQEDFERLILLLHETHGVKITSTFVPPKKAGEGTTLLIRLEKDQGEAHIGGDNKLINEMGPFSGNASVTLNNLIGLHEKTTLGGGWSPRQAGMQLLYFENETPLSSNGLNLMLSGVMNKTHPSRDFRALNIRNKYHHFAVGLNFPLILQRFDRLIARVKFHLENTNNQQRTTQITRKSRRRYIEFGVRYDFSDEILGTTSIDLAYEQGLKNAGATRNVDLSGHSRIEASSVILNMSRHQQLPADFYLLMAAKGQYNTKRGISNARFVIGGPPLNFAYPNGAFIGDAGYESRFEIGHYFGRSLNLGLHDLTVYGAVTNSKLWQRACLPGEKKSHHLEGGAVGMRFAPVEGVQAFVEQGLPFKRHVDGVKFRKKTFVGLHLKSKLGGS